MFPSTATDTARSPRCLRAVLRNAADLAIAFMTLESYGLDDLRRSGPAESREETAAVREEAAAVREEAAAVREEAAAVREAVGAPGRRELQPPRRPRRPGTLSRPVQLCLTPLEPVSSRTAISPRRRTAPQDASL